MTTSAPVPAGSGAAPGGGTVADRPVAGNARHAAAFAGSGRDARPALRVAGVACVDARLGRPAAPGPRPGDRHTVRAAGGPVTDDVIRFRDDPA